MLHVVPRVHIELVRWECGVIGIDAKHERWFNSRQPLAETPPKGFHELGALLRQLGCICHTNCESAPSHGDGGQQECAVACSILQVHSTDPRGNQYGAAIVVPVLRARGHEGARGPQVLLSWVASLCQAKDINALAPLPVSERRFFPVEATPNIESDHLERAE